MTITPSNHQTYHRLYMCHLTRPVGRFAPTRSKDFTTNAFIKENNPPTTPISLLLLLLHPPCMASLTKRSLIWKRFGQRLPKRADPDAEEHTRDAVGRHPSHLHVYPQVNASQGGFWELLPVFRHDSCRLTERRWGDAAAVVFIV